MLKGFKCPGTGRKNNVSTCLNDCMEPCMPEPVVASIWKNATSHVPSVPINERVTVSELVGCPMQAVLKDRVDYYSKPEDEFFAMRGQIVHAIISALESDDWITEKRISRKLFGVPIAGRIDAYRKSRRLLRSWKTIGDKGLIYIRDGPKLEHVIQENLYRWIDPEMVVDRIVISYMTMMGVYSSGHTYKETIYGKPKDTSYVVHIEDLGYKKIFTRLMPETRLYSPPEMEKLLGDLAPAATAIYRARNEKDFDLSNVPIDPGTGKNAGWRCGLCPQEIRDACRKHHPGNKYNPKEGEYIEEKVKASTISPQAQSPYEDVERSVWDQAQVRWSISGDPTQVRWSISDFERALNSDPWAVQTQTRPGRRDDSVDEE